MQPTKAPDSGAALSAVVTRSVTLPGVPSASGAAVLNGVLYVVSDDSPTLFRFTLGYEALTPLNLFKSALAPGARIPKADKPDLEALSPITLNGEPHLLALGSGAAPTRRRGFLISNLSREQPLVKEIDLSNLYSQLENNAAIAAPGFLNLEGIAATPTTVYLVQRGTGRTTSQLVSFPVAGFAGFLQGQAFSESLVVQALPGVASGSITGGYSGITAFQELLFLTASVEDTPDPIQDGQVLGSFVAVLPVGATPEQLLLAPITNAAGQPLPLKAESLEILQQTGPGRYKAIAVTDNDLGHSELLELELWFGEEP